MHNLLIYSDLAKRKCYGMAYYDTNGNLLWRTDDVNSMGQLLKATTGNGAITENRYHDKTHYLLESITSKNIQDFVYRYDKFGNLAARKDSINNVEETFTYDDINRLTGVTLNTGMSAHTVHSAMAYDKLGRMVKKQMDGKTVFDDAEFQSDKPHAIAMATVDEGLLDVSQRIKYTSFDKVSSMSQKNGTISYTYGYDEQRLTMKEDVDGVTRTKTYVGNCEFINENGKERVLTYLAGPYGIFAVVEEEKDEKTLHYIYKDHLGSWTTITDSDGNVEQRQSFDAWGNRRNATKWCGAATDTPLFDRGFTGHEHLYDFGLINMNGRMYDPLTSSFLSPDNYVQDPTSQQGFNRYAYCLYNPLKYTDPSGYLCDNPPYQQQVTRYLMCMNDENAESLNNAGIDHVQVASSNGYSGCSVSYQQGGEWYTYHYSGYVDIGYHGNYNSTPSLDAYAPHDSSQGSGYGVSGCHGNGGYRGGGRAGKGSTSGKYFSTPNHEQSTNGVNSPNKASNNKLGKAGKVLYGVGCMEYGLIDGLVGVSKVLKGVKGIKVLAPANIGISLALTVPSMISEYIDYSNGELTSVEYFNRTSLTVTEFLVPLAATGLAAAGIIGVPVLAVAIIATGIITAVDVAGGFDSLIYDENNRKP